MTVWTVGQLVTAALMNSNLQQLGAFVLAPPLAQMVQNTASSIANGATWTPVLFDTNVLDSDSGHSTTSNTSRYVIQVAGTYLVMGCVCFTANATGSRGVQASKNGTGLQGSTATAQAVSGLTLVFPTVPILVPCAAGDYLEIRGQQFSGGALNTYADPNFASSMLVLRVSN